MDLNHGAGGVACKIVDVFATGESLASFAGFPSVTQTPDEWTWYALHTPHLHTCVPVFMPPALAALSELL